jgi:peptidoglycan hydrolase CwlO-like protein
MDVDVVNDIYANLESNEPDLDLEVEKLQQQNSDLQLHIESLECDVEKLCSKIMDMKKTQDNLAKNISELFKKICQGLHYCLRAITLRPVIVNALKEVG